MEKKYDNILTVILVIAISATLVLAGFWIYDVYMKNKTEKDALDAIKEFDELVAGNKQNVQQVDLVPEEPEEPEVPTEPETKPSQSGSGNNSSKYKNYTILGYIEIPKTKINYPVLEEVTPSALNVSVSKLYGPGINQVGNTVIIGHNNRNGLFFSNNKKLNIGDTINITDLSGNKITYTIYNKYETTDTDTDYMIRDTNNAREISLSTCNDKGDKRLIIWAKEQ